MADQPSFEDHMSRLDKIVVSLEDESVGLEQSVERYQEGVRIVAELRAHLDAMEKKIEVVTADGSTRAFDAAADESETT